jgi:large subunit ribosomal protein L13e
VRKRRSAQSSSPRLPPGPAAAAAAAARGRPTLLLAAPPASTVPASSRLAGRCDCAPPPTRFTALPLTLPPAPPPRPPPPRAVKHNNVLPNGHFRKEWDLRVRTWLDQPARKQRRRDARKAKAAQPGSRPLTSLRPAVHCQTVRYNTKVREGRGFSLEEIKAAGITVAVARTLGVSVDPRRTNKSEESLKTNADRLKAYLAKVVVAERKVNAKAKNVAKAVKLGAGIRSAPAKTVVGMGRRAVPAVTTAAAPVKTVAVTAELTKGSAYAALRQAWVNARMKGKRDKKAKDAAAAAAGEKKADE